MTEAEWLPLREVVRRIEAEGVGLKEVRSAMEAGELPFRRYGTKRFFVESNIRVQRTDIDSWLATRLG